MRTVRHSNSPSSCWWSLRGFQFSFNCRCFDVLFDFRIFRLETLQCLLCHPQLPPRISSSVIRESWVVEDVTIRYVSNRNVANGNSLFLCETEWDVSRAPSNRGELLQLHIIGSPAWLLLNFHRAQPPLGVTMMINKYWRASSKVRSRIRKIVRFKFSRFES